LSGAALKRGDTRKAARFRQSIEAALPGLPSLPPHLARSLEQLDTRLNELRQWKDYVAAPKRIELIEEMEALIGVDEPPEALAEHIRALRQEWRTINKGLAVEAGAESERFEKAFTAAFQPCQVYFAEQAAIRRTNLEARKQVLERLLAFETGLDPEQPDHSLIMRVLREAPQDWRGHAPVDRDASRALDGQFFSTLDRLRAKVTAWYARNTADKQALIARAQQLTTATDTSRAIDEAKRLQTQWKATGPVPHQQSQAMWEEFRGLCNAVFERRQQEYAQQSATLEQAKIQAAALCEQIEQASVEGPADRPSGEAKLREWQEAFHAIGELPRNDARNLRDRYERAMSKYDSQIAGLAQRDARAAETNASKRRDRCAPTSAP
jgi:exonuclease SbcC